MKALRIVLTLTLVFFSCASTVRAQMFWQRIDGDRTWGKRIDCIAGQTNSVLVTSGDTIYSSSTIRAQPWAATAIGFGVSRVFAIAADTSLFYATDRGLILSSYDLSSFSRVNGDFGSVYSVAAINPVITGRECICILSDSGFRCTTNRGVSWRIPSELAAEHVLQLEVSNGLVAVRTERSIMISDDYGSTWQMCPPASFNLKHSLLGMQAGSEWVELFMLDSSLEVYRSRDVGKTWVQMLPACTGSKSIAMSVGSTVSVVTDSGVFAYADWDTTWRKKTGKHGDNPIRTGDASTYFAATDTSLFWDEWNSREQNRGLPGADAWKRYEVRINPLAVNKAGEVYAEYNDRLIRAKSPFNEWLAFPIDFVYGTDGVAIDDNSNVYLGSDKLFLRSTDAGRSWNSVRDSLLANSYEHIYPFTTATGVVLATGHNDYGVMLHRSSDHGANWQSVQTWPLYSQIKTILTKGEPDLYFILTDSGRSVQLWHSSDDGLSWSQVHQFNPSVLPPTVSTDIAGNLLADQDSVLLYSTDHGLTWSPRMNGVRKDRIISTIMINEHDWILQVEPLDLYRTSNKGETWESIAGVDPTLSYYASGLVMDSLGYLYTAHMTGMLKSTVSVFSSPKRIPMAHTTSTVAFPNPTSGSFVIPTSGGRDAIVIRDVLGKVVEPELMQLDPTSVRVDLRILPDGVYFFESHGNKSIHGQVILKKK